MTAFLLSFGWNWLLVPVALWFLRGVWRACLLPRVKYLSHTNVPRHGVMIRLRRQERLPPFRSLDETRLLAGATAVRDSDGYTCREHGDDGTLYRYLKGLRVISDARDAETEELVK